MNLFLIRGLPGSGKSTMGDKMRAILHIRHIEADMFFMENGVYRYNPYKIKLAHDWCQNAVKETLRLGQDVVVTNTATKAWEVEVYQKIAEEFGATFVVLEAKGRWDSVHPIPKDKLDAMKARWEPWPNSSG